MKRIVLLLLLISSKINAQEHFNWGLKEGMTTSRLSGNTYKGFHKFGFVGGGFIKTTLKGNWVVALEIMYTEKGCRNVPTDYSNSYFLQLSYLEFPLLFQYRINRLGIELGPGYGFLMKTKEIIEINGRDYSGTQSFNSREVTFNIGAHYTYSSRFGLNLRFTNSLIPVRKDPSAGGKYYQYGQKNTLLALCLTYEFGNLGSIWR